MEFISIQTTVKIESLMEKMHVRKINFALKKHKNIRHLNCIAFQIIPNLNPFNGNYFSWRRKNSHRLKTHFVFKKRYQHSIRLRAFPGNGNRH